MGCYVSAGTIENLKDFAKKDKMPNFYYISFKWDTPSKYIPKRLMVKAFGDIKPLRDPHFCFDRREMDFLLTGHWDIWVKYTLDKKERLVRVQKEVNVNAALEKNYPELWYLLTEFCSPKEPDALLLPQIEELEKRYWERHDRQQSN